MEPNFILVGKPYGPIEKERLERVKKFNTMYKIQEAYNKIELLEAVNKLIFGLGCIGMAAYLNSKQK